MRVTGIFSIACGVACLLLLVAPVTAKVKGAKHSHHVRILKSKDKGGKSSDDKGGDDDDDDDGGVGIPDVDIDAIVCFSEKAAVQVQGTAAPVSMKDLTVGDYLLTNDGTYQQMYAWGHFNPSKETIFHQIYTASSSTPLELTGEHLVYLHGKSNPVRADSVRAGDVLQSTRATLAEIKKVRHIKRTGVYTPLTTTGKLVVDDIHASSYISLQKTAPEFMQLKGVDIPLAQQDAVHLALSPFRVLCMGVSSSLCQASNEEGIPHYVASGMQFVRWADNTQPLWIQILSITLALVFFGISIFLESTVGASMAPSVILVTGLIYAISKVYGLSVRATKAKDA